MWGKSKDVQFKGSRKSYKFGIKIKNFTPVLTYLVYLYIPDPRPQTPDPVVFSPGD
ncbi:hypothetical protein PL8927_820037 [Planktothrix serta PCC 8927]|uniref:Uncharacterized protein n=1 Tax=Planktothrix serta PCC 8927 TaxID=671068 RepID=A0A7Z9E2Z1_9CYAN|nr:hypothetical protein PL8927_820037 [Planktothrix serta PCC 8927]